MGDSMITGRGVGTIAGGGRMVIDANSSRSGDFSEKVSVGGKDYFLTPAGKRDYDALVVAQPLTGQQIYMRHGLAWLEDNPSPVLRVVLDLGEEVLPTPEDD